jgi:WbqC-like protein family
MNCVILQPAYIPWRGFFHQIQKADCFVFYDDVQYAKHGWFNRNRVKTANGTVWLTIPVASRGNVVHATQIRDIRINWETNWSKKHWMTLRQSYGKAPHFARYAGLLEDHYSRRPELLSDFTIDLTIALARELGLDRRFVRSSELGIPGYRTDRLIQICRAVGADHYISGPSASAYLEEDKLRDAGISLEWMKYDYPEYEQLHPPYDPQVSILDLLFTKGPGAAELIWPTTP